MNRTPAEIIKSLEKEFKKHADKERAPQMSKYMKNLFPYFGIQSPQRRELSRPLMKELLQSHTDLKQTAEILYSKPQREFQYFCIEYLEKAQKQWDEDTLELFEWLITTKSWWDSVDTIASHLMGRYLTQYPKKITKTVNKWNRSDNMWLNRTAIIFQLGYGERTDKDLLYHVILTHNKSKEFFIQKAIGWALRQYAYTDPYEVKDFVTKNDLAPLSKREALKNMAKLIKD